MIELYHNADAVCPFKVRIALAEKGLEWVSHVGPDLRSPEYLAFNPKGYVPTLVHDGKVLLESRIISEYLEDAFPARPLMPREPIARHAARWWSKQVDDSLHLNVFVLTLIARGSGRGEDVDQATREKRLPKDPLKRHIALEVLRESEKSRWAAIAVARFRELLIEIEDTLTKAPWLAGDDYSLADADLTAYVHRLDQLGLDIFWDDLPQVREWRARLMARPSYEAGITRWLSGSASGKYPFADTVCTLGKKHLADRPQ